MATTAPTLTARYVFDQLGLNLKIQVFSTIGTYKASDERSYKGYQIISGEGSFDNSGVKASFTVPGSADPSNPLPLQILWATSADGNGGSLDGIDTYGIELSSGGNLAWSGKDNDFSFQMSPASHDVTLQPMTWPPTGR